MLLISILLWISLLPFESLAQVVRLSGGSETAGRVEVFLNGEWGTVCDDNWDFMDATVVCRQLGFPAALDVFTKVDGGQGIIHLDEVTCNGDESSLLDCPRSSILHDCSHEEDVAIACLPVRLSGGNETAGRVEVFVNGKWGTVCDDNWDVIDATVVCRQLGFLTVLDAFARFGEGQGPIHLDEVACIGDESSILACPRRNTFQDCSHREDVGIACLVPVRLSGGSETTGRVEVILNGEWGTVCDDNWDVMDATVVCRQLGFPAVLDVLTRVDGGQGVIHLNEVTCNGDESSLLDCPRSKNLHDCTHEEDVGIVCSAVRLSGGNETAGRVEVFLYGEWGTVCDDNWDVIDATVVCRQLGFPAVLDALTRFDEGQGPIHFDEMACIGDESSLLACPRNNYFHDCSHREDVGIACLVPGDKSTPLTSVSGHSSALVTQETLSCSHVGKVRFSGGNDSAGRVEICLDETWGSVCDVDWDLKDAEVVCRQLGFEKALAALPKAFFGEGSGSIHLAESRCFGNETTLLSCNHSKRPNCYHKGDACVICEPFVKGEIRLAGGNLSAGRVEVYLDDQWGTVCDDEWDINDADVVCRYIGFNGALSAPKNAAFGEGDGLIHLDSVKCAGDEHSLLACEYKRNPNCKHHEDSSVVCQTSQEMDRIPRMPLILSLCSFAVIIGAVVATVTLFYLRGEQGREVQSENDNNSFILRPLPDTPVETTSDTVDETVVFENCRKQEKEDRTDDLDAMSKEESVSYSSNIYMTVIESVNNDMVNYERMNSIKELEWNVTTEI